MLDSNMFSNRLKRLPPYMFGELNRRKHELRRLGRDIIDFGMGNPDRPTPEHIVNKLKEVVNDPKTHRYSNSRGIPNLRKAIVNKYKRKFGIEFDIEKEVLVTIGSKEGLSHLFLAILNEGDVVVVPTPAFPIHIYAVMIAGGNIVPIKLEREKDFIPDLNDIVKDFYPKPKALILNFPHNPTGAVVDLDFFEHVVEYCRTNNIILIHDFAYWDITFDGYKAPSVMQVKGAKEVAIEFTTMSKSYNMAGWRVGFAVGNPELIEALAKIKGYYDYGLFTAIQVAAITALNGSQDCVEETRLTYQRRRDVLIEGLKKLGWEVPVPKGGMFVWAPLPKEFSHMSSMEFANLLLEEADVAVSPGSGFGAEGEGFIRIALVENEHRIKQAIRNIRRLFQKYGYLK